MMKTWKKLQNMNENPSISFPCLSSKGKEEEEEEEEGEEKRFKKGFSGREKRKR